MIMCNLMFSTMRDFARGWLGTRHNTSTTCDEPIHLRVKTSLRHQAGHLHRIGVWKPIAGGCLVNMSIASGTNSYTLARQKRPKSRPQPFRFLDLPPEIRLIIYSLCVRVEDFELDKQGIPKFRLLHVNRQIRAEVFPCFAQMQICLDEKDRIAKAQTFLRIFDIYCPGRRKDVLLKVAVRLSAELPRHHAVRARWNAFARAEGCNVAYTWKNSKPENIKAWLAKNRKPMFFVNAFLFVSAIASLVTVVRRSEL